MIGSITSFKEELLKVLVNNSGTTINIMPLIKKYCGEDEIIEEGDQNKMRDRLAINTALSDYVKMGWIKVIPTSGISTVIHCDHTLNKMVFTEGGVDVTARLTAKGDIEYKNYLLNQTKSTINQITVGRDFNGSFNQDSEIKNSTISSVNENPKVSKNWIQKNKILIGIITAVISSLILKYIFHIG